MQESLPPLSEQAQQLMPGEYEHYKGNRYRVLAVARHSESLEEVVVYQAQYGDRSYWVRPVAMFFDSVDYNGTVVPRFRYLQK